MVIILLFKKRLTLLTKALTFFFIIFYNCPDATAESIPVLDEVMVTSQQNVRFLNGTAADISVLTSEDISRLNAQTLPEILETLASVSIFERGTPGSQSDIAIRGSSIESVLLLVNGIRLHDPQTGHFTMDIPVDLNSIERIEIMSGGGSSIYGSSTSGGVINIVTKNNSDGTRGGVALGSYKSGKVDITHSKNLLGANFSLSLRGGRSDGYRESSDLEYSGIDITGSYDSDLWKLRWNAGLLKKAFGAGNFYSPYPSYEKTLTVQSGLHAARILSDRKMIRFRIGSRGHGDDFILDENRPEIYRNTHYNRSTQIAAEYLSDIRPNVFMLFGAETERMGISSGSLGTHPEYNNALYGELSSKIKRSDLSFSMRFDSVSGNETVFSPAFGFVFTLSDISRLKIRAEKSFRSPNFTERYYKSPSNVGDPSLKSEHSSSFTFGYDITGKKSNYGISFFTRETTNVIDWVRYKGETIWASANHGRLVTNGVEIKLQLAILEKWRTGLNAVVLDQSVDKRKGIESKYSLNPLGKTISSELSGPVFANINWVVVARYEKLLQGDGRTPLCIRFSRNFGNIKAIFSVKNLLNEYYEEIPGLPAPGRWVNLKIEYL